MARHAGAVIGVEEDDGVVCEAVFRELVEEGAGLLIHGGDAVVVARQVAADERGVGVVGWEGNFGGIVDFFGREAGLDLVTELVVGPDHGARLVRGHDD